MIYTFIWTQFYYTNDQAFFTPKSQCYIFYAEIAHYWYRYYTYVAYCRPLIYCQNKFLWISKKKKTIIPIPKRAKYNSKKPNTNMYIDCGLVPYLYFIYNVLRRYANVFVHESGFFFINNLWGEITFGGFSFNPLLNLTLKIAILYTLSNTFINIFYLNVSQC